MPSLIDVTKPVFGVPSTESQRSNWTIAKSEIEALQTLSSANAAGITTVQSNLSAHIADTANPHAVTPAQLGFTNPILDRLSPGAIGSVTPAAFVGTIVGVVDSFVSGVSGKGIRSDTGSGSDTKDVSLTGAGDFTVTRGGVIKAYGINHATLPGYVDIMAGQPGGLVRLIDHNGTTAWTVNNVAGIPRFEYGNSGVLQASTIFGNDFGNLTLTGGGGLTPLRGGHIIVYGNQSPTVPGSINLIGGEVAGGEINISPSASTFGARLRIRSTHQEQTGLSGASRTFTNIVPDGAFVLGVAARVTTAITGATSWHLGTAGDTDRFGANIAVALNTTSDNRNWTATTETPFFTANTSLIATAIGGSFTGGAIRVTVFYFDTTAPTD